MRQKLENRAFLTNGKHRIELYRDSIISDDINSKTLDLCCFDIFRHMNTCDACAAIINRVIGRSKPQEEPWYIVIDEEYSLLDLDRNCGSMDDQNVNSVVYRIGHRKDPHGNMIMRLHVKRYNVDLKKEIAINEECENFLCCAFFKKEINQAA